MHVHLKYDPGNTPKYLSSRNESMNPSKDSYMNVQAAFLASEYPVFPGSFVEKTLSPLNCLCSLVRDQNCICVCQFLSSFFLVLSVGFFFFFACFLKLINYLLVALGLVAVHRLLTVAALLVVEHRLMG